MNTYLEKASEFLRKSNVSLLIQGGIIDKKPLWIDDDKKNANWGKYYFITLQNRETGEKYSFDYWGSIKDKEENRKPNAYDILACLDTFSDGYSFDEFCSCYGYSTDSIKAEKIFQAVQKQNEGLKRVFSKSQLKALNEIK